MYANLGISDVCMLCTRRRIPIIASEKVEREFGTGALKITPGHDPTDFEIGQTSGLQIINIMSNDAALNENAGSYEGLDRVEARTRVWEDIKVSVRLGKLNTS